MIQSCSVRDVRTYLPKGINIGASIYQYLHNSNTSDVRSNVQGGVVVLAHSKGVER